MIKQSYEGYGKRLVETVTAIVIIGGPVITWSASVVVGGTAVFLYPHLPDGKETTYLIASWIILIPPASMAGMFFAVKLVKMFLESAGMNPPTPPKKKHKNGYWTRVYDENRLTHVINNGVGDSDD